MSYVSYLRCDECGYLLAEDLCRGFMVGEGEVTFDRTDKYGNRLHICKTCKGKKESKRWAELKSRLLTSDK